MQQKFLQTTTTTTMYRILIICGFLLTVSTAAFNNNNNNKNTNNAPEDNKVFSRYYHMFKEGELDALIKEIPNLNIIKSVWDHENWYVIIEKVGKTPE